MNDEIMAKLIGRAKQAPPPSLEPEKPAQAAAEPAEDPQEVVETALEPVVEPPKKPKKPEKSPVGFTISRTESPPKAPAGRPSARMVELMGGFIDLVRRIPPAGYQSHKLAVMAMLKVGDDDGMAAFLKETREALEEVSKVKPWEPAAGRTGDRGEGGAN